MNANSTVRVKVEAGGDQVVAHVGLHALGAFGDRLGLGHSLSSRIAITGERLPLHDRGKVLVQAMLMLAGGGEACSDIEALRAQERLFGSVPSDSTLYRTLRAIDAETLAGLWEAMAGARAQVWRRSAATTGTAPVVLDIDSSLVEVHSENKQGTGPTYKGGFGYNPMLCTADATGEVLAAQLRPGNAGTTTVADHLAVLDAAVAQLPAEIAAGHRQGDDASAVRRQLRVRTDSAGCSRGFVWGCRARNIGFAVVARSNDQVHAAISRVLADEGRWSPALHQDGEEREGAAVAELTDLVDLSDWPPGTRLVVRREPLHPGAQQSLFPSLSYRYWGHYTDAEGDPVALRRGHAGPRPRGGHHLPPARLGLRALPLHRPRRQPGLAGAGVLLRRPGAVVPAVVLHRPVGPRQPQGPALGGVAQPGSGGAQGRPLGGPAPRRLAHGRRAGRGLQAHRPARLSAPSPPSADHAPSLRARAPEINGSQQPLVEHRWFGVDREHRQMPGHSSPTSPIMPASPAKPFS